MSTRRRFISMLPAVPVAADSIKQDALNKNHGGTLGMVPSINSSLSNVVLSTDIAWFKKEIADLISGKKDDECRQIARDSAYRLSPSVAALRSVSASTAFRMQEELIYREEKRRRHRYLLSRISKSE